MSLPYKTKTKDEIPPELQRFYVEREGVWVLDLVGGVDKARVDEILAANATLTKRIEDHEHRFQGIDPDEVRKLIEDKRKLEEAQQLKAGEFERVLESRVTTVKSTLEKQLGVVAAERDSLHARLSSIQIDQAVLTEATQRGLRPTAIPDITARARSTFRLVNGTPQALAADGQTARVGRDGLTPLTVAEWIEQQLAEAPHLFAANAGGGAAGDGSGGAGTQTVRNPFRKETWNLTEQMKLQKTDPALAARWQAAA